MFAVNHAILTNVCRRLYLFTEILDYTIYYHDELDELVESDPVL